MEPNAIFDAVPADRYDLLSKSELATLHRGEEELRIKLQRECERLRSELHIKDQKQLVLEESFVTLKHKIFGKSSEKLSRAKEGKEKKRGSQKRVQLPSERYPNVLVIEKEIEFGELPSCPCCQGKMRDSGLTEDSEVLTVIPKKYLIHRHKRHKYSCGSCYQAVVTAPRVPSIKPGSSYSDEMILDVAMSKYLDLIPIERYVQMAKRSGLPGLPANSLIELTHHLSEFVESVYQKIKDEVFSEEIVHADETPHRMLEGDKKSNWYLWGFSTNRSSYFQMEDTRSGEVASSLLRDSNCRYLVSDVFSGYNRAVREANRFRQQNDLPALESLYCHAHARRKFREAEKNYPEEALFFLKCYSKIYRLNKKDHKTTLSPQQRREWQHLYLRLMERKGVSLKFSVSSKSSLGKAVHYFLKNFEGLSRFSRDPRLPLDNNAQERQLRSPVIGRKTWYGTHSKRGAKTASVLFSIVESCKLNGISAREYLQELVSAVHRGESSFTPKEYKERRENSS